MTSVGIPPYVQYWPNSERKNDDTIYVSIVCPGNTDFLRPSNQTKGFTHSTVNSRTMTTNERLLRSNAANLVTINSWASKCPTRVKWSDVDR